MALRRKLFGGFLRHPGFWTTLCLTLLVTFAANMGAFAATNPANIISYQGRLLDANGVPVTAASATIIFRFYDSPAGGSCLWSNSSSMCASATGRSVTLTDGLFSENLGDFATDGYATISDSVFSDHASVYLDVNVNGESLTPRKLLTAAPYALNAQALDGLSSNSYLNLSGNTLAAADVFSVDAASTEHSATSVYNTTFKPASGAGLFAGSITEAQSPAAGLASGQFLAGEFYNLAPDSDDAANSGIIGSVVRLTSAGDAAKAIGSYVDFASQTGGYSGASIRDISGYEADISVQPTLADDNLNTVLGSSVNVSSVGSNKLNELTGYQFVIDQLDTLPTNLFGVYLGKNDGATGGSGINIDGNWQYGARVNGPATGLYFSAPTTTALASEADLKIEAGADTVVNLPATGDFLVKDNGNTFAAFNTVSNGTGQLSLTSRLDIGSRVESLLSISQANDVGSNNNGTGTSALATIMSNDTGSVGDLLYILNENAGGYSFRVDDVSGDSSPFLIDADGNTLIGATGETLLNSGFSPNGNELFVAGAIGTEDGVYTDGSFYATNGVGTTTLTMGGLSQSSGEPLTVQTTASDLTIKSNTSGDIVLSPAGTSGVGIGTATPITALEVPLRIPTTYSSSRATDTSPRSIAIQGRYAYVTAITGPTLKIYDISDPTSIPAAVGSVAVNSSPYGVDVEGRYAYVTSYGTNTLQIVDVSNVASPSVVGSVATGSNPWGVTVQGRYAYVAGFGSGKIEIYDVSNPTAPVAAGSVSLTSAPIHIALQGRYAYVADNIGNTVVAVDISNPAVPTVVSTVSVTSPIGIKVQGRYVYTISNVSGGTNAFNVIDVADPSAMSVVGTTSASGNYPQDIFVQGRYAIAAGGGTTSLDVFSIASPTAPSLIGSITSSAGPEEVYVQGRYVYATLQSASKLESYDLGGAYLQQVETGGLETTSLSVRNNIQAAEGSFLGGLTVGQSVRVSGGVSIAATAFTQATTDTTTLNTLDVEGVSLTQNTAAGTINWRGANIVMPNITQTTGTITADGLRMVNGTITTGGTENIINLAAAGVGAGTLRALNIGGITPSSGTETAVTIGAGWDTAISLTTGAATTAWNLDATTNDSTLTTGVVDLNIDTATNSNVGLNIDYTSQSGISAASDVFAQVINLTQNDADGDLFGLFVNANAVSTTQSGTNYYECLLCAENDENSSAAVLAAVWINSTAATGGSITNGILINTTDVTVDLRMQNGERLLNDTDGTVLIDDGSTTLISTSTTTTSINLSAQVGGTAQRLCHDGADAATGVQQVGDCGATQADLAEYYGVADDATAGHIVVPSGEATEGTYYGGDTTFANVQKSGGAYQLAIGAVSTNPSGEILGEAAKPSLTNPKPIALVGRTPLKVNAEGGSIAAGDPIATSSTPGVGMKATQPGPVVGYALSAWAGPGEGTIVAFIQPGWNAAASVATDGSMPLFTDSFAFTSLGTATATETGKDSHTLSFRGSGWNGSSAEDIGMGIKLAATDATAYRLSFTNKTDTEVAYVTGTGDLVLSGKLYPSDRGAAQTDKYIYYDGSAGPGGDFMRTNASGWSTGSYDFAEMFPSAQGLAPGELVVASPGGNETVERSGMAYQKTLLGIVSSKPGFLAGDNKEGHFPVALKGRVPTLVNNENGPIAIGDPLTSSSTPGYAMKAVKAGPVVGYALEPFSGTHGSVVAFVSLGWWEPDAVTAPVTATTSGIANTASQSPVGSSASSLTLEGNLFMNGNDILGVGRIAGIADRWSIEEDGTVKTEATFKAVITSLQNEKVDTYATLNREQKVTISGTGRLTNGMATVQFEDIDAKFNDITSTTAPVRVQVTLRGPANGVYVSQADHNGFDVRELANGTSTVDFDWYVEAYRLGQEPPTMATTPAADPVPVDAATAPPVTDTPPVTDPVSTVTDPAPAQVPTDPAPADPVVWTPAPAPDPTLTDPAPAETAPADSAPTTP